MQCGTTQQWITETIEAKEHWSTDRGYHCFKDADDKLAYYPINNTIIEEI